MTRKALTPSQERDVAVYYACGAPIAYIARRWGISRRLVHKTLVGLGVSADRRGVGGTCEDS